MLKIHILYDFKEGPWGGGNQFLTALRNNLIQKGAYTDNVVEAQVIIFNSHHFGRNVHFAYKLHKIRMSSPTTAILHRVDGPISAVRGHDDPADQIIATANSIFSDATIYQTNWSKEEAHRRKMALHPRSVTILNAPSQELFNRSDIKKRQKGKKIRLIATSWSSNMRKGFAYYSFLDQHLDWDKYEMTFVGNSPISFRNIRHISPLNTEEISKILRDHDIFITGSANDPCSNSLIEALHSGLPSIALSSGGHPEIVKDGGLLFSSDQELLEAITKVSQNIKDYQKNIRLPTLSDIADQYLEFAIKVYGEKNENKVNIKSHTVGIIFILNLNIKMIAARFRDYCSALLRKLK